MSGNILTKDGITGVNHLLICCSLSATTRKKLHAGTTAPKADQCCSQNYQGKRQIEAKNTYERKTRKQYHRNVMQRFSTDFHYRLQHDCKHRCLETKKHRSNESNLAIKSVNAGQHHYCKHSRQDKQYPRYQSSAPAVHKPTEIDR